jgi:hypothetical protein
MANFITNASGTVAVRKASVDILEIVTIPQDTEPVTYKYNLVARLSDNKLIGYLGVVFETETTLEAIQTKAATVLAALEA